MFRDQMKKGTAPLMILALLEHEPRHGYELSKLIQQRSDGVLRVHAASLYPLLYRLEKKRWIQGRWVEKPGERRRRFYHITRLGREHLEAQRESWLELVHAIGRIAGVGHA
jgi:PadR family transcriptional regulator PadR